MIIFPAFAAAIAISACRLLGVQISTMSISSRASSFFQSVSIDSKPHWSANCFAFSSTAIFSYKGKNNQYLGEQAYQFGNELQLIIGANDNFLIGKKIINTSLSIRYRKALSDRFNDVTMPSTGGQWIFLAPSLGFNFSQKIALNATFEIPIFSEVEGTQLSPTYRINVGAFFKINKKNELFKI